MLCPICELQVQVLSYSRLSRVTNSLWLVVVVLGAGLAAFLTVRSYTDWKADQVITTLKDTAKPVTDLAFPTVTVCGMGQHMANVRKALEDNFDNWLQERGEEWDVSSLDLMMARYMEETFQIREGGMTILDILNTMTAPSVEAAISANTAASARACSLQGRRKRQALAGLLPLYWQ